MGEAKRRKVLTAPRPKLRVRQRELFLPVELDDRLQKLCPPQWSLQDWLVGALEAFASWGEQEKEREANKTRLVQPYRTMPPGPPVPVQVGPRNWA